MIAAHAFRIALGGRAGRWCWSAGVVRRCGSQPRSARPRIVAYFDNSNGIFVGDEVRILGVPVGKIDTIEPQPARVKITFWFDSKYKVPADAKAVDPVARRW